MVGRGWILQIPSLSGYAATMAYLPARKLAIAISVTVNENPGTASAASSPAWPASARSSAISSLPESCRATSTSRDTTSSTPRTDRMAGMSG